MADESTYTTGASIIDSEYISRTVGKAILEHSIMLPLMRIENLQGVPARVASFPIAPSMTLTTKSTDNTATSNAAWTPTSVEATCVEYSWKTVVTDMLKESSVTDPMAQIVMEAERALLDKVDSIAMALFGGFTGATQAAGSTGVDLTHLACLVALRNLKTNFKGGADNAVFVLSPMGVYDLGAELITPVTNGASPAYARTDLSSLFGSAVQNTGMTSALAGFVAGKYPVFSSTNVPADGTTDRHGCCFVPGEAIGCAIKWMPRVEFGRDLPNGINGDIVMASIAFGVCELRDTAGVKIFEDY